MNMKKPLAAAMLTMKITFTTRFKNALIGATAWKFSISPMLLTISRTIAPSSTVTSIRIGQRTQAGRLYSKFSGKYKPKRSIESGQSPFMMVRNVSPKSRDTGPHDSVPTAYTVQSPNNTKISSHADLSRGRRAATQNPSNRQNTGRTTFMVMMKR